MVTQIVKVFAIVVSLATGEPATVEIDKKFDSLEACNAWAAEKNERVGQLLDSGNTLVLQTSRGPVALVDVWCEADGRKA